jgi:hypothetical protein
MNHATLGGQSAYPSSAGIVTMNEEYRADRLAQRLARRVAQGIHQDAPEATDTATVTHEDVWTMRENRRVVEGR